MAHSITPSDKKFEFTSRERMVSMALIGIGLAGIIIGFLMNRDNMGRAWGNLLSNSFFFLGITMASSFFISAHYLGYGGWHVGFKRVPEAISMTLPFNVAILFLVILFGHTDLYEWSRPVPKTDIELSNKLVYFSWPFFWTRFVLFLGVLTFLTISMRRVSLKEDMLPDAFSDRRLYKLNLTNASLFILFFAVYISVSSWDWLMSVDVHWFSTMYGWYTFASFWVSGIAAITLFVLYLKNRGYLEWVNENHIHVLGIMMFAFSVFWTYLGFCQYMLIWYANLPEETTYFKYRYEHYGVLFYAIFIINFVVPFLLLMKRSNKRNYNNVIAIAVIILIGHFVDFFLMVMPGTAKDHWGFNIMEITTPCLFIGMVIYVTFSSLSKAALAPKNHPMLNESLNHHI